MRASAYLKKLKTTIIGPTDSFPLSVRIFHSVLAISMIALLYSIPLNLFVDLPFIALISSIAFLLISGIFYLSRYRGQTAIARTIVCVIGTALFVANYFLNSGIDGPTGYFFLLLMVAMVAIVPVEQYWFWVSSNVLLILGLHLLQFHYPDYVPYTYVERGDRYIDMSSAYLIVVVVILTCFYITRKSYETERLRAERTAERLSELDAEKNKLFSIISHDLRSPLANIQGYLELLTEYEFSEAEKQEIQTRLLNSTRGTLEMVNNVLHWSKNQMNGAQFKTEQLELARVLQPQIELADNIAARKDIRVHTSFEPGASVWGNSEMIQLVVRNLLNNAIKFTAPGGKIDVTTSMNGDRCLISVTDSGNGHPIQLSDEIFQLSGGSAPGTVNEKGVGLGLVLCRENVKALRGTIWYQCHEQSGVAFFVELPAAQ